VLEVLKYSNSDLLLNVACYSQVYSDSLMFLALRMIHRTHFPLPIKTSRATQPSSLPSLPNSMRVVRSERSSGSPPSTSPPPPSPPSSSNPSPPSTTRSTAPYNVCQFIKHMKYDKAELVEIEAVLKPARKCDVCSSTPAKPCARCKSTFYCSPSCQKLAWKKHKKTCKPPTSPPATSSSLRTLHKGIALLNMCIQRPGAGDGPTSVVVDFLLPGPAY